MGEGLGEGKPN